MVDVSELIGRENDSKLVHSRRQWMKSRCDVREKKPDLFIMTDIMTL